MAAAAPAAGAAASSGGGGGGQWAQYASSGGAIAEPIIGAAMMGVQHQWASQAASDQQNFAQFMANTVYRRAVRDMRLAGLNPILAVDKGGAPVPSVGMAQVPGGKIDTGSSGRQVAESFRVGEELKALKANRMRLEAAAIEAVNSAKASAYLPEKAYHEAGAEGERWSTLRESAGLMRAQAEATSAQAGKTRAETTLREADIPSAQALEELYRKYPWLRQFGAAIRDVTR